MRISDWSSDVCSSDLHKVVRTHPVTGRKCIYVNEGQTARILDMPEDESRALLQELWAHCTRPEFQYRHRWRVGDLVMWDNIRSEEHTSELQSLKRISYAVFCLKKKKKQQRRTMKTTTDTKHV